MKFDKLQLAMIAALCFVLLLKLAAIVGVIYVAWHFITKYW